jgi:putative oxidoreductase
MREATWRQTTWRRALVPRFSGWRAWATAAVRIVTGVLFITFSIGKFADHAKEAVDFDHYGVPFPDAAVYLSGTIEFVCGVLLVLGLLTRVAAVLLAANLVVAIATAGRVEGGSFHLGVGPAMLLAMLFLVWAGAGVLALDSRLLLRLQRS